jgi:hypothetical protein
MKILKILSITVFVFYGISYIAVPALADNAVHVDNSESISIGATDNFTTNLNNGVYSLASTGSSVGNIAVTNLIHNAPTDVANPYHALDAAGLDFLRKYEYQVLFSKKM